MGNLTAQLVILVLNTVKSVRIRNYSSACFPAFVLNTEIYGVRKQENMDKKNSEYGHFLRNEKTEIR